MVAVKKESGSRIVRLQKGVLSLLFVVMLSSCADKDESFIDKSVHDLYNEAMDRFEKGSYIRAAKIFSEVERQHPYSNWAVKAQLMSAYSYYLSKKYEDAIEGFKVFVQLHPGHPEVAYAYYMLGLCYYEQIPTVQRDQRPTQESLRAFQEVLQRFPDSPYAKDAKYKLDLVQDHLAGKEMEIGRFYLNQQAYLAALNRFKGVVDQYQTTSHVPEALHRMVECYLALGIKDQAQATAAVLDHNYGHSTWYKDSYDMLQKAGLVP